MTEIRDKIAEALLVWWEADAGDSLRAVPEAIDSAYEYADALVPVVADLVAQAKRAAEMRGSGWNAGATS